MIKLSQLNTDEFLDKTCELVPYLVEIAQDEELISIVTEKVARPEGASNDEMRKMVMEIGTKKVNKAIPLVLKKHRNAVYGVLATMTNKSVEEVSKQNAFKTLKDVKELINDEDLKALFLELTA